MTLLMQMASMVAPVIKMVVMMAVLTGSGVTDDGSDNSAGVVIKMIIDSGNKDDD
jgi:hypothetical protein